MLSIDLGMELCYVNNKTLLPKAQETAEVGELQIGSCPAVFCGALIFNLGGRCDSL